MSPQRLFIVGAPKCGTTALASYLSSHPDIFVTDPKEPLFFLDEMDPSRKIRNKQHYEALFRDSGSCRVFCEASVWYLYSTTALKKIKANYPDAKIIIMTRDPVEFIASLHSQQYFGGREKEKDLEKAWRREVERFSDAKIETLDTLEHLRGWRLLYPELIKHEKYVSRYRRFFGKKNVFVIDHSELKEDAKTVYESVLCFIGLQGDGRQHFSIVNANKAPRSVFLRDRLFWLANQSWLIESTLWLKRHLSIGSFGVYTKLQAMNAIESRRPNVSEALSREIRFMTECK